MNKTVWSETGIRWIANKEERDTILKGNMIYRGTKLFKSVTDFKGNIIRTFIMQKKCSRLGCLKNYTDEENSDTACRFHNGNPIFHDIKKGWTCCNKIVYDWDEFKNIEPCQVGRHSDEKVNVDFFKSQTVSRAEEGIKNFGEQPKVIKNIDDYLAAEQKKEDSKEKPQQEIVKASDGKYYCGNAGCADKTYEPSKNKEGDCKFHSGNANFHDRKKFWTCCKQEAYDWDDFMKIPPCCVGSHTPKYKDVKK